MSESSAITKMKTTQVIDWKEVALKMLISRAMDDLEENKLVPEKKVLYNFQQEVMN